MAANTYQEDGDLITIASSPYTVTSGQGVKVGVLFGIATTDAAISTEVTIAMEGVFYVAKTSAQAWAVGQGIYWNDGNRAFTTTGTGGIYVGAATVAAANPSSFGYVRLHGAPQASQTDGSS